jgi:hypothetical protein
MQAPEAPAHDPALARVLALDHLGLAVRRARVALHRPAKRLVPSVLRHAAVADARSIPRRRKAQ